MNRPDIRELECFVAVAEHLNFSRAARQLHLSQPPLTRQVQSLEEKLGARLLERDTHSVALTDCGRLFLEDARAILGQLDRAGESVRRAGRGEPLRLRLAFIGALLDEKLVRLIRRFREAHPDCQVQIVDLPPSAQLEAIGNGQLDGGFIGAMPKRYSGDISFLVWNREPLLLAVPENHPLARVRSLQWKQLDGLSWVLVSGQAAPAYRRQFSDLLERHGLKARIVQESERVPAVLTMVAAGSGVTMVSHSAEHLIPQGVVFRRLPTPQPVLEHAFASRTKARPALLEDFIGLLRRDAERR